MARRELSFDGPVLRVVHERIRHYEAMMRNRISHTGKSMANRKTLQKQKKSKSLQNQKKPPLSKPIVEAVIEELGEIRSKLISALAEELNQTMATAVLRTLVRRIKKYQKNRAHINRLLTSGETRKRKKEQEEVLSSEPIDTALLKELRNLAWPLISALTEELHQICQSCSLFQFEAFRKYNYSPIEVLLRLVNVASLLDVMKSESQNKPSPVMLMRRFDKGCLTYGYMTGKEVHLLTENDRKFISLLRFLVTSQPAGTTAYADYGIFPSDYSTKVEIVRSTDKKIYHGAFLEEDGGSKGEGKTEVHPKTPSPKMKSSIGPACCPMKFCQSGTSTLVMDKAQAAINWDSLQKTKIQELLVFSASELARHCAQLESLYLRDFISEAILFYKLHGTWETYICPKPGCFRWFKEDKLLIGHLMSDHFPIFHRIGRWPSPEDIPAEERCVDALSKMVWKPIHLQGALDLLTRMSLDHTCVSKADVCGCCDRFSSLKWPLSKDPLRCELLEKLGKSFQVLIAKEREASFSLLSRGYLMKMNVLAFENIFTHLAPNDRVLFLGCSLAHSPLSFCFLGKKALSFFVDLVNKMCQIVTQAAVCSRNEKLDPNKHDVIWNNSEILGGVSFSVDDDRFVLDPAMAISLCCGEWSISSLGSAPCCPSVMQVPVEASDVFKKVEDKLVSLLHAVLAVKSRFAALISNKRWASFRFPWLQSGFKSEIEPLELDQLQLECELENLEPQIRYLCALDLRMYIFPLMSSFLQKRLDQFPTTCDLETAESEEDPDWISTNGLSEEELTEEMVDSDEDGAETTAEQYPDDGDSSETSSEENCEIPALTDIDSTIRESFGQGNKDSGIFLWISVSNILEYFKQAGLDTGHSSRGEGFTCFRLNKAWKYMHCYCCNKSFLDPETHMVHMENEHQLGLPYDKSWLVPFPGINIANFSQVGKESASGVEGVITLDPTYNYFLVDTAKFYELTVNDSEDVSLIKQKQFMDVLKGLQDQICDIKCLLSTKSKHLSYLEVVHCLHEILLNGNHSLALLVTWLHKLSLSRSLAGTNQLFQLVFLCQVLEHAQAPLSNETVKHSFAKMQDHLITKLHELDRKIEELIVQKNKSWRLLSDLSVCDYRSKILHSVRSFIQETFGITCNVFSGIFDEIKNALFSLHRFDLLRGHITRSFTVEEVFPGKVLISRMKNKSAWSYAYIGFGLKFSGEWYITDKRRERITGSFRFDGSSNWDGIGSGTTGKLSLDIKPTDFQRMKHFRRSLDEGLNVAVCLKLSHLFRDNFEQNFQC